MTKDNHGHDISETASHSPAAGGDLKQNVYIKARAAECDFDFLEERDPSLMEKPEATSGSTPMGLLKEVRLVDECEISSDMNTERPSARETAVHSLQKSSSFSGHRQTYHESGEENFITTLPSRTAKNLSNRVSEADIEVRASGPEELSNKETNSTL